MLSAHVQRAGTRTCTPQALLQASSGAGVTFAHRQDCRSRAARAEFDAVDVSVGGASQHLCAVRRRRHVVDGALHLHRRLVYPLLALAYVRCHRAVTTGHHHARVVGRSERQHTAAAARHECVERPALDLRTGMGSNANHHGKPMGEPAVRDNAKRNGKRLNAR